MAFRDITTHVLEEGDNIGSFTADSAVSAGQVVTVDADYAVGPSTTDGERVVGVALYDAEAGETVAVAQSGCEVLCTSGTGTVSAGDPVASHGGTGESGEVDTAATGDYVIGDALEGDAGTNDDVRVAIDLGGQVN